MTSLFLQGLLHTVRKANRTMPTKTRKWKHPKKVEVRQCSALGCTKWAQRAGLCCSHGGKKIRAKCSHVDDEGGRCQNVFKRGGLCRVSAITGRHVFASSVCLHSVAATEARSIQAQNLRPQRMQEGSQAATTGLLRCPLLPCCCRESCGWCFEGCM